MIPPSPPPVRWQAESYFQTRLTAGEGIEPFLGLRRFRVNVTGESARERVFVQFFYKDGFHQSNDDHVWLHDVSWRRHTDTGTLTLGQFRPAFGRQRLVGDRDLLLVDRALASDAFVPAGGMASSFARDIGAQWETRFAPGWTGFAGVFLGNGSMLQGRIGHGGPVLVARALRRVGTDKRFFEWGGAVATRDNRGRDFSRAFPGLSDFHGRDTRFSAEAGFRAGAWRGGAEWLAARFDGRDGSPDRWARGGYVEAARALRPGLEAVAMLQFHDPNRSVVDRNDMRGVSLGVNWTPPGTRDRWQFDYVVRRERANPLANDALQLQYQRFLTR